MSEHIEKMMAAFFDAIHPWESAYPNARLNFVAVSRGQSLHILGARIYLAAVFREAPKASFLAGDLVAAQLELSGGVDVVRQAVEKIIMSEGFEIGGHGTLVLVPESNQNVSVGPPDLFHVEGLKQGNRLAVLTMSGARGDTLAPQPQTDWMLRAGERPFDSLAELCAEYGVGGPQSTLTLFEVVASAATEVWIPSSIKDGKADLALWLAPKLDRAKARLGYRVLDKGAVVERGSTNGDMLTWGERFGDIVGQLSLEVPRGAIVQCIASYDGHAHHLRWFADPQTYQNSRAALLAGVDQSGKLLRGYLLPELPPSGKAADDFEAAVAWMLWGLGFSPVSFGTNAKTRDAFDILVASPRGDFVVVECTLGLLRAESKLSKLSAREASVRKILAASGLQHVRVLPVIVTAMSKDEVKADLNAALETGILALTREDLEAVFDGERLRFANADQIFEEALQRLAESQKNLDAPTLL